MATTQKRFPTAEMPLMDELRDKLLTVLDQDDSLYELSSLFPDIVDDILKTNMPTTPAKTIKQLQHNDSQTLELLHAIPRHLLGSLIRGTIAYDAASDPALMEYSGTQVDAGVYVIAISIQGRDGKFLTGGETKMVIEYLESYIDVYEVGDKYDPRDMAHRSKVLTASDIDTQFGQVSQVRRGEPRMVTCAKDVDNTRALIASLRLRMAPSLSVADGDDAQQLQSPLYVGCSNQLVKRLADYNTDKGMLTGVNRMLTLLLSVLNFARLKPRITRRVVLKVWSPEQLPLAERLVIALARSSLWQEGLNVAEGGGKPGNKKLNLSDSRMYMMGRMPHMGANLEKSVEDLQQRASYLKNLDEIKETGKQICTIAREIEGRQLQLQTSTAEYQQLEAKLAKRADSLRKQLEALMSERMVWQELDEIAQMIAPYLPRRSGTDTVDDEEVIAETP